MEPKQIRETKQMEELKEILPPLGQDDYSRLKESIKEQGIQESLKILPDGAIIDGYHRKKIAQELGIKDIPYEIKRLDKDEALELGISLNLARRNLSFEQKKEIIEKLRKRGWTQEKVAKLVGMTRRRIGQIEIRSNGNISITSIPDLRYKISKGAENEIFKRANKGEIQTVIAKDYGISQRRVGQIIEKKEKQIRKKEEAKKRALQYEKEEGIEIFHGDFKEITKQFPDNHFNHIITDPPYPEKYLPLWNDLSRIANRILKPGGFCITYSGTYHLLEVINRLSEHLEYYWQVIIKQIEETEIPERKIFTMYKPLLIFAKPPIKTQINYIRDIIEGAGRTKDSHEWQQPVEEAEEILEKFTEVNDLILDPMFGSGTTLIACKNKKRRCTGIDDKEENIIKARSRLVGEIL